MPDILVGKHPSLATFLLVTLSVATFGVATARHYEPKYTVVGKYSSITQAVCIHIPARPGFSPGRLIWIVIRALARPPIRMHWPGLKKNPAEPVGIDTYCLRIHDHILEASPRALIWVSIFPSH